MNIAIETTSFRIAEDRGERFLCGRRVDGFGNEHWPVIDNLTLPNESRKSLLALIKELCEVIDTRSNIIRNLEQQLKECGAHRAS